MRDAADYQQTLNALLPQGALWDAMRSDDAMQSLLLAIADEFARADGRAGDLLLEMDPRTTLDLLAEWEAFAGLPDICVGDIEYTLQERRGALHAKLIATRNLSIPYLIAAAASIGHTITIQEVRPSLSGVMMAGDEVVVAHADRHWFQVTTLVANTYSFIAGASVAGDELGFWRPVRLECLLNRLKPAHTAILWNYQI